MERICPRKETWLLIFIFFLIFAQALIGAVTLAAGSNVNDDFQLEVYLNGSDAISPPILVIDPAKPMSIRIWTHDIKQDINMKNLSVETLLFGRVSIPIKTFPLNGDYGPKRDYDETFPFDNPKLSLGNWNIPLVTGRHRIAVTLDYSVGGRSKSWHLTKDIEILGGISIIVIAAVAVGGTAAFFAARAFIRAGMKAGKPSAETIARPSITERRFLQERTFIEKPGKFMEEHRVLFKGMRTHIRVRIGLADEKWLALGDQFPDDKLPPNKKDWTLDVVLTEPNHLDNALRDKIVYPSAGSSPECDFLVVPRDNQYFEGRVTVLHRGRVLQTGVLKGRVVANEGEILPEDEIAFSSIAQVRFETASLEARREFDLAFVENHSGDGTHRSQGITDEDAWLVDLSTCTELIAEINGTLSGAAHTTADFDGNLCSDYGSDVMRALAQSGFYLHEEIFKNFQGNRQKLAEAEYLQLINTRIDSLVPFEFIYDFSFPNDTAKTCTKWKESLAEQKPPFSYCKVDDCRKKAREMFSCDFVCPLGFWGLGKVMERQIPDQSIGPRVQVRPEPAAGHETISLGGTVLIGAHKKEEGSKTEEPLVLDRVIEACKAQFGVPAREAKTWKEWPVLVRSLKPRVLILLSHTEGSGSAVSLEIGGQALKCGEINWHYIKPEDNDSIKPLVALLGCDTTGSGMRYGGAVSRFQNEGAAIVIGTIAEVFGQHSVRVAEMLVNRLNQGSPNNRRVGEVMRALKREALREGLLMGICLVAFGDADWILG